jgi:hypothetical protein
VSSARSEKDPACAFAEDKDREVCLQKTNLLLLGVAAGPLVMPPDSQIKALIRMMEIMRVWLDTWTSILLRLSAAKSSAALHSQYHASDATQHQHQTK